MTDDGGEPDFLMSLIDTLTCGLGASILLFVIFVILATVQEPVAQGAGARPVDARRTSATGLGAPDMLWLRLRGDCPFIRSVETHPEHGFGVVRLDDRRGREEPEDANTCVALFRHSDPPEASDFFARHLPARGLRITAVHGGRELTPPGGARWEYLPGSRGGGSLLQVFSLHPNDPEEPLRPSSRRLLPP